MSWQTGLIGGLTFCIVIYVAYEILDAVRHARREREERWDWTADWKRRLDAEARRQRWGGGRQ